MSGYPAGSAEGNNGLESLFAQLRQQQSRPINLEPSYNYYNNGNSGYFGQPPQHPQQPQQPPHGYQQPSVQSAVPTPPAPAPQPPRDTSAIMSPIENPPARNPPATGGTSNADRTSSLLNLLRYSQPSTSPASQLQPLPIGTPLPPTREVSKAFAEAEVPARSSSSKSHGPSGSDLLATLMGAVQPKPAQQPSPQLPESARNSFGAPASSPPADTQAYLLQLLHQKPSQTDVATSPKPTKILTPPSKASSQQDDTAEITEGIEEVSLENPEIDFAPAPTPPLFAKDAAPPKGFFTYVNPFDQLAASSPRNRTPKNAAATSPSPAFQILKHPRHDSPDTKGKQSERSSASSPAHAKRKLEQGSQPASSSVTPQPEPVAEAVPVKETVHEALTEVGDVVDKQVQEAIARAEAVESQASIEDDLRALLAAKTEKEFEASAEIAAKSIKKELEKEENSAALDTLPPQVAEAVQEIIEDAAQGHIADSWESADAEDSPIKEDEEESILTVYNFPMKPWTSINVIPPKEPLPTFRDEAVTPVARLKKEFDQVDRTLVTASNNFMVFAIPKNGGIRVIRQDDGKDVKLFADTHDRIFTVVASVGSQKESVIGTGISGTVYWALVKDGEADHIEDDEPESYAFALPPMQSMDSESPGGVLKTRARKSSGHPDFFAVGRGKFIHIVWPSVILKQSYLKSGKDRLVDTEKYLSKLSLKVNTGKAGKDFSFSEDDTTIVSLDKAGRVKFWDIRGLTATDSLGMPTASQQVEVTEPLITFTTTPANEKSWPTSVMLVDKLRPYQRGGALRYLIVGMKQNHTLQLWDLALKKPVQEIHLPHSKESDAVCSVLYHAASGVIAVGHPTRNSIYFLHLSAPKYHLPRNMTQADFMKKIALDEPGTMKPESTAVLSGMREYSFASNGTLRSLDMLQTPNSQATPDEPAPIFELYAMHSKGVTCLNIKQADLGWDYENRVIKGVMADEAGLVVVEPLKEIPALPTPEVADTVAHPQAPIRIASRPAAKETSAKETPKKPLTGEASSFVPKSDEKAEKKDVSNSSIGLPYATNQEKSEKPEKKKRRRVTAENNTPSGPSTTPQNAQQSKTIIMDPSSNVRNLPKPADAVHQEPYDFKTAETRIANDLKKVFADSFDLLHRNIKDDRRTEAAVAEAKQDAMLRLVSATLQDNIEPSLDRSVGKGIQKAVVPAITDVVMKTVNDQLGPKLSTYLAQALPKELSRALGDAVAKSLQQPQTLKLMAESLAKSVTFNVEEHFNVLMQNVITPAFTQLTIRTSQQIAAEVQRKSSEQIMLLQQQFQQQKQADNMKIDQLTQLVTGLTETISSMAAGQSEFQAQFLRMQQQAAIDRGQVSRQSESATTRASASVSSTVLTGPVEKSEEELEFEAMKAGIEKAMGEGEYENAVIQWLQTRREQEFFAKYFVHYAPDFIRELSPLLLLSLGATISIEFQGQHLNQRIFWMETILAAFQTHVNNGTYDEQVRDLIPKIMGIYIQRLEHLFMRISQVSAHDQLLKKLSQMVTTANYILQNSGQGQFGTPSRRA